jgi:hypothetical protein
MEARDWKRFYNNCTSCHRVGGYISDIITNNTVNIDTAITNKSMPPWKPNSNNRPFKGETCLKPEEITKIKQWITGGIRQGNGVAPTPPSFNSGSQLTNIDASLSTLNYTVSTNVDDYKTFVIPSNNSTKR